MAPEIHMIPTLREDPDVSPQELKYEALPVDIFSAGIILFIIHVGYFPFLTAEMRDPLFAIIVNDGWEKFWEFFEVKTNKNFCQDFKDLI